MRFRIRHMAILLCIITCMHPVSVGAFEWGKLVGYGVFWGNSSNQTQKSQTWGNPRGANQSQATSSTSSQSWFSSGGKSSWISSIVYSITPNWILNVFNSVNNFVSYTKRHKFSLLMCVGSWWMTANTKGSMAQLSTTTGVASTMYLLYQHNREFQDALAEHRHQIEQQMKQHHEETQKEVDNQHEQTRQYIDGQLQSVKGEVNELGENVKGVQTSCNQMNNTLQSLQNENQDLRQQLTDVKTEVTGHVQGLREEIFNRLDNIQNEQATKDDVRREILGMQQNVRNRFEQLDKLVTKEDLEGFKNEILRKMQSLQSLNNNDSSYGSEGVQSLINQKTKKLEDIVQSINRRLKNLENAAHHIQINKDNHRKVAHSSHGSISSKMNLKVSGLHSSDVSQHSSIVPGVNFHNAQNMHSHPLRRSFQNYHHGHGGALSLAMKMATTPSETGFHNRAITHDESY